MKRNKIKEATSLEWDRILQIAELERKNYEAARSNRDNKKTKNLKILKTEKQFIEVKPQTMTIPLFKRNVNKVAQKKTTGNTHG